MENICCFCNKQTDTLQPTTGYWSDEEERQGYAIKYTCCYECFTKVVMPELTRKSEWYETEQ